jgi:hypothetical protein
VSVGIGIGSTENFAHERIIKYFYLHDNMMYNIQFFTSKTIILTFYRKCEFCYIFLILIPNFVNKLISLVSYPYVYKNNFNCSYVTEIFLKLKSFSVL